MSNYRTTVYYKNPDGTHRRVTLRAGSRRELERKKQEIKEKEKQGIDLANNDTFGYWSNKWYENTKANQGLSDSQERNYRSMLKLLNSEFGRAKFRYLTMNRFQEFINDLSAKNPHTGKPTSASYLRKLKTTARAIALYASGSHVDGVSAFYNVTIPRNAPTNKVTALTEEQIQHVVEFPHEMQLFTMLCLFGGFRRGEALALQWKHIDLEHSTIQVVQSLNWCPNQPVIKAGGKTANAYRTVVVPPVLVSFLKSYKDAQAVYPAPQAYVCHNKEGKPYTAQEFKRRWASYNHALNRRYGNFGAGVDVDGIPDSRLPVKVPPMHTHQCRHTFATLCYLQGLSVIDTMQELGHAQPAVTIGIYTDLKNYHKFDLSEDFKRKLQTSYRIPLNGNSNNDIIKLG